MTALVGYGPLHAGYEPLPSAGARLVGHAARGRHGRVGLGVLVLVGARPPPPRRRQPRRRALQREARDLRAGGALCALCKVHIRPCAQVSAAQRKRPLSARPLGLDE